jgi:hypothetical protein
MTKPTAKPPLVAELAAAGARSAEPTGPERGRVASEFCRLSIWVLEIDRQLVFGRRLHRQVGGLFALEDAIDVGGGAGILVQLIRPVGDQAARTGKIAEGVDRGQLVPGRQRGERPRMVRPELARRQDQSAIRTLREVRNGTLDFPGGRIRSQLFSTLAKGGRA